MNKCNCHLRWEIGSTGPLCDYIEYFLGHQKKGILIQLASEKFKYDILRFKGRDILTHHFQKYENFDFHISNANYISEYSFFSFKDKVLFSGKTFEFADNWSDSWYLISTPLKSIEENVFQEYASVLYLDQYMPVTLKNILD